MRFVFRADASPQIGAGHVMRTSAIAEEAIEQGFECQFVGSILDIEWLRAHIDGLGFSKIVSPDNFEKQDGATILVLDSYTLDVDDPFILNGSWQIIVSVVDEITPDYPCNLAIHPGLDGTWYRGKSRLLSGAGFIPMRKSLSKRKRELSKHVSQILVFGGGTDTLHFSLNIAEVLSGLQGFNAACFYSMEKEVIQSLDKRFVVRSAGQNLNEDISEADLILTTASTSSLETIAHGLPLGIACAVPNQESYYRALGSLGLAVQIGSCNSLGIWDINASEIAKLIDNFDLRISMVSKGKDFIDSGGASRIIEEILGLIDK